MPGIAGDRADPAGRPTDLAVMDRSGPRELSSTTLSSNSSFFHLPLTSSGSSSCLLAATVTPADALRLAASVRAGPFRPGACPGNAGTPHPASEVDLYWRHCVAKNRVEGQQQWTELSRRRWQRAYEDSEPFVGRVLG